jgi:tRNA pseudouridine-54 N-methylase
MNTIEQNTQISPLEKFRKDLETTVQIKTTGNNLDMKELVVQRVGIEKLVADAQSLPELNEDALDAATKGQELSVQSVIMEANLFRKSKQELMNLRQIYLTSGDKIRLAAVNEVIAENETAEKKVTGRSVDSGSGLFKSFRNGVVNILPFNRK